MPSFSPGDVVRVPFPYTNRDTTQFRPALVVSDGTLGSGLLLWTVMITSDQNRHWPGDVPITDLTAAGLPASSLVRTLKIATIDSAMATPVGRVDDVVLNTVQQHLLAHLALTPRT